MPRNLHEKFRTISSKFGTQKTTFEKVRFDGKMFRQFGLTGSDTDFFNTISALFPLAGTASERVELSFDSNKWRTLNVPRTQKNEFQVDGDMLFVQSDASASFRYIELSKVAANPFEISWVWRVDHHSPVVLQTVKGGDDRPLAVHIWFDDTSDTHLFGRLGEVFGYPRVGHLITYVWGATEPAGSILPNQHFDRGRVFVIVGNDGALGRWSTVRRNIAQDYRRAFGKEPDLSTLRYVAVSADSEDQDGYSIGAVSNLVLVSK